MIGSSLLLLIPLFGAVAVALAPARNARWIALLASSVTFALAVVVAGLFPNWGDGGMWPADASIRWLGELGVSISFGMDSVSLLLVLLTTMLMPLCVLGSFSAVTQRLREYYAWMLVLGAAMTGVFVARDLVFFYVCFEFTLVPMYFLIAIYGADNRSRAATKFFIYTFTGSLIALAGFLYVAWQQARVGGWSFDIPTLTTFAAHMDPTEQALVLLALMAGFAVKVPVFPLHTWLPLAHTEAPTAGSVILAGVLLKLGTYGLYRFVLPMVPGAVVEHAPLVAVLAIIGIVYAALVCWVQTDIKRLVAYSSVSHLGFCVLGLFALNALGSQGSVLYMINHGLSTGALFFLVGMIYERYHTRDMDRLGGLARRMPVWSFFMIFFVLASVGLPGLNGFVSEVLCLIGAFTASPDATPYPGVLGPWYAAIAATGMIFAAMYLLLLAGRVVWGPLKEPATREGHGGSGGAEAGGHDHPGTDAPRPRGAGGHAGAGERHGLPADLNAREIAVLAPLAILCLVLGVYPAPVTDALGPAIDRTLEPYPDLVRAHEAQRVARTALGAEGEAIP
jgi:NADH-quinone oxidoreductase subunit M